MESEETLGQAVVELLYSHSIYCDQMTGSHGINGLVSLDAPPIFGLSRKGAPRKKGCASGTEGSGPPDWTFSDVVAHVWVHVQPRPSDSDGDNYRYKSLYPKTPGLWVPREFTCPR